MLTDDLRKLADDWHLEDNHKCHFGLWYRGPDVIRQAADEIDRLQAEVQLCGLYQQRLASAILKHNLCFDFQAEHDSAKRAREALGETE